MKHRAKIFFLFSYCLFSLNTLAVSSKEEEISNLKKQIASLQQRLQELEKEKEMENPKKENQKIGLVLS